MVDNYSDSFERMTGTLYVAGLLGILINGMQLRQRWDNLRLMEL